ncbi:MAG: hypothetical protein ACPGJS_07520 [Flammeovirgaceae bacterium]
MKKIQAFLVAICFILGLIACSPSNSGSDGETPKGNAGNSNIKPANDFEAFLVDNLFDVSAGDVEGAIDKMIDPSLGVYLVYKPGALPTVQKHTSAADLKKTQAYLFESFVGVAAQPKKGELPYFDCEAWDKEGCFYKEVTNSNLLQATMTQMSEMLDTAFPEAETKSAEKTDASVSRVMILTDAQLELSFGQVNGAWKLLIINIADFDCGA